MKIAIKKIAFIFILIVAGFLVGYVTHLTLLKTGITDYLWEKKLSQQEKIIKSSGKCFSLKKGWTVHQKSNNPQDELLGILNKRKTQIFIEHLNPNLLLSIEENLSFIKEKEGYNIKYLKELKSYYLTINNGELLFSSQNSLDLESLATGNIVKEIKCR